MKNPRHETSATLARLVKNAGWISYNLPSRNNILIYRRLFVGIKRPHFHALPKGKRKECRQENSGT
jgi:hypothetical protein